MINGTDMLLYTIGRMHITLSIANCTRMKLWEIPKNSKPKGEVGRVPTDEWGITKLIIRIPVSTDT